MEYAPTQEKQFACPAFNRQAGKAPEV